MRESYIIIGDCREAMREMPDASVHCVVTSPPYWNLRDYGTAEWEGGDPEHDHDHDRIPARNGRGGSGSPGKQTPNAFPSDLPAAHCSCGAVRIDQQLGLEPTPEQYVERMVGVFREARRVLRDDGVLWLVLGDSYAANRSPHGIKPKDLVGIPWRVAFALQADGWYLRSDTIWHKPNPMPESVRDRPTKAHEYLFLLTKSARYFYDHEAIKEPATSAREARWDNGKNGHGGGKTHAGQGSSTRKFPANPAKRNRRSVWTVTTKPFKGAHFATFPPDLIEPCIMAGTSEYGACAACGAAWKRQVKRVLSFESNAARAGATPDFLNTKGKWRNGGGAGNRNLKAGPVTRTATVGWKPRCKCDADVVPCTVLDPLFGAGTTGLVAQRLGRRWIGCELSEDYAEMAMERIRSNNGS